MPRDDLVWASAIGLGRFLEFGVIGAHRSSKKRPPPWDHYMTLGVVLQLGPRNFPPLRARYPCRGLGCEVRGLRLGAQGLWDGNCVLRGRISGLGVRGKG